MERRLRSASSGDLRALYPQFADRLSASGEGDLVNQMCAWDFNRYMVDDVLVKVDRATMYHSIEGREPLLDHRIVEFAAQLPVRFKIGEGGETKLILKRLLARYLPKELFDLPKRGFAPPIVPWIEDHYRAHFVEALEDRSGLFDRRTLADLVGRYGRGEPVNYHLLWHLFSFQNWYNRWMAEA